MVQCKKCKLFVSTKKDDILRCKGRCEGVYHRKCVQNMSQFLKSEVCDSCARGEDSPGIHPPKIAIDMNKATVETVLSELNNKLEIIFNLRNQLEELKETVDFYSEKYQEMTEFKDSAQKKMSALENKNTYLQKVNETLEERIAQLEVKEIEKEIEIVGLYQLEKEDTKKTVIEIAKKLKLNPREIENAKRVGREKMDDGRPRLRPIVVTLTSQNAKKEWLTPGPSLPGGARGAVHPGRSPFKGDPFKWSAFRSQDYGYSKFKAYNKTHIYMEQVSVELDGQVIDSFWLVKDNPSSTVL